MFAVSFARWLTEPDYLYKYLGIVSSVGNMGTHLRAHDLTSPFRKRYLRTSVRYLVHRQRSAACRAIPKLKTFHDTLVSLPIPTIAIRTTHRIRIVDSFTGAIP